MSTNLQQVLELLCTDSALIFLRHENSTNGFESFRKLCQRYKLSKKTMSIGRLTNVLKPHFDKNNFEDSFSAWEDEITEYEKEARTTLSDDLLIA